MNEQQRAVECIDKINEVLIEYGFTIAGDYNGDAYIRDQESGTTYDMR